MNKKNIKPLVLSSLAALSLGSMSVAGTFALFTDKAETTVSIEAGKVDVSTGVTIQKAYSLNTSDATSVTSETHATFVNGGTADISGSTVQVAYWTPGDGLKLRTSPENASNVNILGRFKISLVGELAPALEIRVRAANALDNTDDNVLYGRKGAGMLVSDWESIAYTTPATKPTAYDIDIVFPDHDNGEIKFGADNKDNQYMDKTATVVIAYEAVQGNADVGANLLDRINTTLATESIRDNGYNKTMFEALADIDEANLADEAAVKTAGYVWSPETDQFYDFSSAPADAYKYFKIADTKAAAGDYSIYASSAWNVSPVSVSGVGFDVGSHTSDIASVSYTGLGETNARTNIIRTNALETSVSVNAPFDTIYHYGNAGSLTLNAIAGNSYHENGKVVFAEVKNGRMALEKGAEVTQIHLAVTGTGEQAHFDDIVIAKDEAVDMPKFSRDPVTIPETGRLVVALQEGTEQITEQTELDYVWLTAVGVYEQITVSESKTEAGNTFAANLGSTEQEKKNAAQQIANNITFSDDGVDYKVVAEPVIVDEVVTGWTYDVVKEDGTAAPADTYVATAVVATNTVEVEKNSVAIETIVENGITADEKEIAKEEALVSDVETSGEYVARIGYKGYETIAAAVAAVKNGETITMMKDNTIQETVNVNKEGVAFSLDLDGHTIDTVLDGDNLHLIVFNVTKGSMTIKDSSTGGTGTINGKAIINNDTLIVEKANINAVDFVNGVAALTNYGYLWVKGGVFTSVGGSRDYGAGSLINTKDGSALIDGGTYTVGSGNFRYAITNSGMMLVNNANVIGFNGAFGMSGGSAIINGGSFSRINDAVVGTSGHAIYASDGLLIVNGGEFTNNCIDAADGSTCLVDGGTVEINGGTFTPCGDGDSYGPAASEVISCLIINGGTFRSGIIDWGGNIQITGGTFASNPDHIANGCSAVKNGDNTYTVTGTSTDDPLIDTSYVTNYEGESVISNDGSSIEICGVDYNVTNNTFTFNNKIYLILKTRQYPSVGTVDYWYMVGEEEEEHNTENFYAPISTSWLCPGENITLLENVTLNKWIICAMKSGQFNLYFDEYSIITNGYGIKLKSGVSVRTDKCVDDLFYDNFGNEITPIQDGIMYIYTA